MQKFFGRITKIGELKTGMGQNGPWAIIEFTMTNTAIDGSSESLDLVANGSFANSINDLRSIIEDPEKSTFAGMYMAEYKPQCRTFKGRDGNVFNVTELKLNSISRIV